MQMFNKDTGSACGGRNLTGGRRALRLFPGPVRSAAAVVWIAVVVGACGEDARDPLTAGPEPAAGIVEVALTPSGEAIGAVRFLVDGADLSEPTSAGQAHEVFARRTSNGWDVAVIGADLEGALVRLAVPDVRAALSEVHVRLTEVANSRNELLRDLDGIRTSVRRGR